MYKGYRCFRGGFQGVPGGGLRGWWCTGGAETTFDTCSHATKSGGMWSTRWLPVATHVCLLIKILNENATAKMK